MEHNTPQRPRPTQRQQQAAGTPPRRTATGQAAARPKKRRRRFSRAMRRAMVLAVALVVLLGMAWVVTGIIEGFEKNPLDFVQPEDDSTAVLPEGGAATPESTLPTWNYVGPVQQNTDTMQVAAAEKRLISLPENGRIDMQYFNTAVFVGDSITQGLELYKRQGIPNAKYCAYKSIGPQGILNGSLWKRADEVEEVPLDALVAHQPDNVYVLLGTNAMVSMDNDILLEYYGAMLDVMKERLGPDVGIYVQSITPVLQTVSSRFSLEDITYLNNQLAQLAWEKGLYFLDLHEALAGDDGWLRPDYCDSSDGYHLNPAGYAAWVEYLVTHTVYNPRHAHLYLEGSHYYQQLPQVA